MGTWSKPLFVIASPAPASTYSLDVTAFSDLHLRAWKHNAFLQPVYNPSSRIWEEKQIWNLDEFMATGCETHKIMDYMTHAAIARWQALFEILAMQNPTLESLQFHFLCVDSSEPFMFEWKRGIEYFTMNVGSADSVWYTKKNPKYKPEYDDPRLLFDETAYKKNLEKIVYRSSIMKSVPGMWLFN